VIVTGYPRDIKAFYMRSNDDGRTVAAMDVLVPRIGEIIGGSQREERLDVLLARISRAGSRGMKKKATAGISTCADSAAWSIRASAWASSG
jgi:aspartyl/asparaginyl-tRNA synthetase